MKILLLIITFIASSSYPKAQEFQYAVTGNGIDYYYKIEQDMVGFTKDIWVKGINPAKRVKTKSGKYITKEGGSTMTYMTVWCTSKNYEMKNFIKYDSKGNVIARDDSYSPSRPAVPGSPIGTIVEKVCSK